MPQQPDSPYIEAGFKAGTGGRNADARYDYSRPWETYPEQRVSAALNAVTNMTVGEIQAIRPPLPQVPLFRPTTGYRTEQPTIEDVINCDQIWRAPDDFSGSFGSYSGSSYPNMCQF